VTLALPRASDSLQRALAADMSASATFAPVRDRFRAIARTIVGEADALDENGWIELEAIIERGLASRPQAVRRQLRILVRALDLIPLFRYGRTFCALDRERRMRFLLAVQDAPLLLLRRGFWGLRTLVFMGYYGRAEAAQQIGYRADLRGWDARPERSRGNAR
jgi:hypothetical protein